MEPMSETENKPTLGRKPLGLKKSVEAGEVKQTFSHGRTNKVVVEVKRRKMLKTGGEGAEAATAPVVEAAPAPVVEAAQPPPPATPAPEAPPTAAETPQERVARLQREAEEARLAALEEANRREVEVRQRALEGERRRAEENRKAEQQEADAPTAPPESEPAGESDAPTAAPAPRRFRPVARPEVKRPELAAAPKRPEPALAKKPERGGVRGGADRNDRRQSGKLTVARALNDDEGARARSLAALKRAREKERRAHFAGQSAPREKQVRDVVVPEAITVQELANRMAEKGADLVKSLFNMGMMVTVNQTIDQDTAELLVEEFGHNITR
ncbi:MAG: translation initiation factor IF-2, partial [Alphaproteobacteria bacterium]|nr:translation initiation factor IF-2 [Alphaproteobacteria bacterium]